MLSWATAVLAGITAITGTVASFGAGALIAASFLGIAVPVLLSAAQSWRAINLFGDKAKAYRTASDQLRNLSLELDAVRQSAAKGEEAKVREFIDQIQEVMKNENTNWVAAPEGGT